MHTHTQHHQHTHVPLVLPVYVYVYGVCMNDFSCMRYKDGMETEQNRAALVPAEYAHQLIIVTAVDVAVFSSFVKARAIAYVYECMDCVLFVWGNEKER